MPKDSEEEQMPGQQRISVVLEHGRNLSKSVSGKIGRRHFLRKTNYAKVMG